MLYKEFANSFYMAIYHLSVKIVSRSKNQSAVALAAYRSGQNYAIYLTIKLSIIPVNQKLSFLKFFYLNMFQKSFSIDKLFGMILNLPNETVMLQHPEKSNLLYLLNCLSNNKNNLLAILPRLLQKTVCVLI